MATDSVRSIRCQAGYFVAQGALFSGSRNCCRNSAATGSGAACFSERIRQWQRVQRAIGRNRRKPRAATARRRGRLQGRGGRIAAIRGRFVFVFGLRPHVVIEETLPRQRAGERQDLDLRCRRSVAGRCSIANAQPGQKSLDSSISQSAPLRAWPAAACPWRSPPDSASAGSISFTGIGLAPLLGSRAQWRRTETGLALQHGGGDGAGEFGAPTSPHSGRVRSDRAMRSSGGMAGVGQQAAHEQCAQFGDLAFVDARAGWSAGPIAEAAVQSERRQVPATTR